MRRKGPEDLPLNHTLLGITVGFVMVVGYFESTLLREMMSISPFINIVEEQGIASKFFQHGLSVIISLALTAGVLYLILLTFKKEARTYKTFFALQGTYLIIQFIAIAGVATTLIIINLNVQIVILMFGIFLVLGGLALFIWAVVINCHILSRALDSGLGMGFLIMIVHILVVGILNYFVLDFVGIDPVIQMEQPAIES